jgi:hypothetical protein
MSVFDPLSVPCTHCGAMPYKPCMRVGASGRKARLTHAGRKALAMQEGAPTGFTRVEWSGAWAITPMPGWVCEGCGCVVAVTASHSERCAR